MRILILGASGGCGRWAVRLARDRGWDVTAMIRPTTAYDPPSAVRVVRGSVLEPRDVTPALEGQRVVVSCLGPQRANPLNPWSPLRPPTGIAAASARVLVDALAGSTVTRICAISAAGVGDSVGRMPWVMRWLVRHSTIGEMYRDLDAMEELYAASGVTWFAVRPVTLVNAGPSERARVLARYRTHSIISRADVAGWMLDVVDPAREIGDPTPMIGWW